jgi:hypothetical protein
VGESGHAVSWRGSTVSHAPTDANPKNSKLARVMKPAVSRTIPVASRITHSTEARRKRPLKPGIPRLVATIARRERPSPAAARSCMTVLTGIGMSPTTVRCIPAETTETRNDRAVLRPVEVGSTVTASTP